MPELLTCHPLTYQITLLPKTWTEYDLLFLHQKTWNRVIQMHICHWLPSFDVWPLVVKKNKKMSNKNTVLTCSPLASYRCTYGPHRRPISRLQVHCSSVMGFLWTANRSFNPFNPLWPKSLSWSTVGGNFIKLMNSGNNHDKMTAPQTLLLLLLLFFFTLGTYDPEGDEKLRKLIYKLGYDHQSVRSVDGKLSCRRTAL